MAMFKTLRTAIVTGLIVVLAGCQNSGGINTGGSVDPRLSSSQDIEFFNKSGIMACAGGAVLGALACAASNSSHKAVCMIAAAVAGCGIGVGANAYLDNQRKKYATEEEQLNASIKDVQAENNRIQNASEVAKSVIASDKETLAKIEKAMASDAVKKEELQKQIKGVDANIAYLRNIISDMKKHEKQWQEVSTVISQSGSNTKKLDTEIAQMRDKIGSLQWELDSLYDQRTALKVS
jgi:septal ring factor EnvC (AmiA/AmiB activator)